MNLADAIVFIVDDDALIRDALEQLVKSVGLKAQSFALVQDFLDAELVAKPSCVVSDIRMPSLSGLDLQQQLAERDFSPPIIFITGHGTVTMSVKAMKAGAVDFLQKPFEDQELLDAIQHAIEKSRHTLVQSLEKQSLQRRLHSLTVREYEILTLVVDGLLNKQIAYALNMSENTVKTHRARIMRKMEVDSLVKLVKMTEKAGVSS